MVDAGETPYEAAERELYEETGLNIFNIIDYMPSLIVSNSFYDVISLNYYMFLQVAY